MRITHTTAQEVYIESTEGVQLTYKVRFQFNGIKIDGENIETGRKTSELIKGNWSWNSNINKHITFYAQGYKRVPELIRKFCKVQNDTDSMTDYFDTDSFDLKPDHKFFNPAALAIIHRAEKHINNVSRRKKISEGLRRQFIEQDTHHIEEIYNFITA